jgi:hypothetical protein
MWSSAGLSSVVRSIRTLDRQDASELRYVAAVTIWVRSPFQPACGAETSHRVQPGVLSPRPDRVARRAGGVAENMTVVAISRRHCIHGTTLRDNIESAGILVHKTDMLGQEVSSPLQYSPGRCKRWSLSLKIL